MTRFITFFCFAFAALITSSVNAQFSDNFDSYGTGVDVSGMNGWQGWDGNPAFSASTSDTQALSAPNSIAITNTSDLINRMDQPVQITSGRWLMTVDQYIPAGHAGQTFFIMQNTYNDGGPYNWSIELLFNGTTGLVTDDFDPGWAGVPYIVDQWVQIKICIDLDSDTVSQYYNGDLIPNTFNGKGETGASWSLRSENGGGTGNGAVQIGALDLFSLPGAGTIFYDNVELKSIFLGDADDSGTPLDNGDIGSFLMALTMPAAYQAAFPNVDVDCRLDMNGDGLFNNGDIGAFLAALTGP